MFTHHFVGSVPISEIRSLKRKYNEVAEFSDVDEQELVAAAEKAEKEYRKRQRMNEEPVFSPCNEEELVRMFSHKFHIHIVVFYFLFPHCLLTERVLLRCTD
jgi:hypothetical protein